MRQGLSQDWRTSSPAMIWMWVNPEIDDEELTALKSIDGVVEVEGLLTTNIEWRLSPSDPWQPAGLMARDDYGEQKYNKLALFIGEGLILGVLSWLIALPLSIPAGYAMTQAMGTALQSEIVYIYTPAGALYWLGIIVVLSIIASWFPARGATRISVRESLAYQ
jgi:hypothetical protein